MNVENTPWLLLAAGTGCVLAIIGSCAFLQIESGRVERAAIAREGSGESSAPLLHVESATLKSRRTMLARGAVAAVDARARDNVSTVNVLPAESHVSQPPEEDSTASVNRELHSSRAPVFQPRFQFPANVSPIAAAKVNPSALGTSLAVGDARVEVESYSLDAADENAGIDVAITPVSERAKRRETAGLHRRDLRGPVAGFTYEEALFRARWGWSATDQIKRAALTATSVSAER